MAGKVKTWVWVVVAIAAAGILGLIAIAAIGFYFVSSHIDTAAVTPAAAAGEIEAARARFEGQAPLIELDSAGRFVRAHTDRPAPEGAVPPSRLHLRAFDPSDGRIVRFTLPFWLLRMRAGTATIDLDGSRISLDDLKLTVEDIERYGPALLVDHRGAQGERVLIWSE